MWVAAGRGGLVICFVVCVCCVVLLWRVVVGYDADAVARSSLLGCLCSRWWLEGWASYVSEGHCSGHFDGDSSSKSTDLLMYVHEESGRAPTALLLDGGGVNSI